MKLFLQYFAFTFPMSVLFFYYVVKLELELAWDKRQQAINRVSAAMTTVSMRRGW